MITLQRLTLDEKLPTEQISQIDVVLVENTGNYVRLSAFD